MEGLIAIYVVIGVVDALNFATNPAAAHRPQWLGSDSKLGTKLVGYCAVTVLWPLLGATKC